MRKRLVEKAKIIAQLPPEGAPEHESIYVLSTKQSRESTMMGGPVERYWSEYRETKSTEVNAEERGRWNERNEDDRKRQSTSFLENLKRLREEAAQRRKEAVGAEEANEDEAAQTWWFSRCFPCLFHI